MHRYRNILFARYIYDMLPSLEVLMFKTNVLFDFVIKVQHR